jgi:hypothetical protein
MKKRLLAALSILALLLIGAALVGAAEQRSTITGEVIDIAGFVQNGARGEEYAESGRFHAEKGFPVGILTEEGHIYLAVYRDPAPASSLEPANEQLAPLMGKEVVAQGVISEASGVKLIEIALVAEM